MGLQLGKRRDNATGVPHLGWSSPRLYRAVAVFPWFWCCFRRVGASTAFSVLGGFGLAHQNGVTWMEFTIARFRLGSLMVAQGCEEQAWTGGLAPRSRKCCSSHSLAGSSLCREAPAFQLELSGLATNAGLRICHRLCWHLRELVLAGLAFQHIHHRNVSGYLAEEPGAARTNIVCPEP